MEKLIETTKKCIKWYAEKNKSATINELLDCKTQIITNNFYIAENLADLKSDYNLCYYGRKIEFNRSKNELMRPKIGKGMSAAQAESEAIEITGEYLKNELEHESAAYRLELFLKHSQYVADDIMQRISVLKKEQFDSKTLNVT